MDFRPVETNLREMFRSLAAGRERAEVRELDGVWIANLSAAFQMFNAVFLSAPVTGEEEFHARIAAGAQFMMARGLPWSFWICEEWLAAPVRKRCAKICERSGLQLASEMPGMVIERMHAPDRRLPNLSFRCVTNEQERRAFCSVGSVCFHVPPGWFDEIFDRRMKDRQDFQAWVGYLNGEPIATAATVTTAGVIGLYNVAVLPGLQGPWLCRNGHAARGREGPNANGPGTRCPAIHATGDPYVRAAGLFTSDADHGVHVLERYTWRTPPGDAISPPSYLRLGPVGCGAGRT